MAIAVLAIAFAGYSAYGWAALVRIGALDNPPRLFVGFLALAALWVAAQKRPTAITLLLLAVLPLFGNHPGGRYMEFVNLPLAASTGGLVAAARRDHRRRPDGTIWRIAGLYVLTALLAMIPTIPTLFVRAAQINDPWLFVAEALTAAEDNPLYSISSIALLTLTASWAFALAWSGATDHFALRAYRVLTVAFFGVTAVGISDYCGFTSLGPRYLHQIDGRAQHLVGLQSIFWHPAWFAWYFAMVFGIAIGVLSVESGRKRLLLGVGITLCYVFFFFNPQRGGLIAIHVVLFLFVWHALGKTAEPRRWRQALVATVAAILVLTTAVLIVPGARAAVACGNLLSIERSINNAIDFLQPREGANRSSERLRLWQAAILMWRDAPALGIGEGSFAWRYRDYWLPVPLSMRLLTAMPTACGFSCWRHEESPVWLLVYCSCLPSPELCRLAGAIRYVGPASPDLSWHWPRSSRTLSLACCSTSKRFKCFSG